MKLEAIGLTGRFVAVGVAALARLELMPQVVTWSNLTARSYYDMAQQLQTGDSDEAWTW